MVFADMLKHQSFSTISSSFIGFIGKKYKAITVGERFKVEDYLRFVPSDATNKLIGNVTANNYGPITISKIGNEWYVTGRDIGYSDIKAIADENTSIYDFMKVIVTRNSDSNDGGDNGDDDQDQDDGSDYDDDPETGGDSGDTELKW